MKGSVSEVHYSGFTIKLFAWIIFGGSSIIAIFTIPSLWEEGSSKVVTTFAVVFLIVFQICMTVATMFFLTETLERFDYRVDSSNRLAAVNGCGDEYTSVPFIDLQADFDTTEDNLNEMIRMCVFMIVASLFTGVLTIPPYYCIHYVADLNDGRGFYMGADDIEKEQQDKIASTDGKPAARKVEAAVSGRN